MSCERHADAILEHALGEPAPPELDRHLLACAGCREALEHERRLLGRIDGELREAVSVFPSRELLPRVRARVTEAAASRPWRMFWLVPVAAGLVAVIGAVLLLRQPAPTSSPAIQPRSAVSPAVAESSRGIPAARVSVPAPPARPPVRRPRLERAKSEPEVLVPPGEAELIRRFAAALQTRRVDAASVVATGNQPTADLAIPLLDQIPPLEVKPLPSGLDPEGVNR